MRIRSRRSPQIDSIVAARYSKKRQDLRRNFRRRSNAEQSGYGVPSKARLRRNWLLLPMELSKAGVRWCLCLGAI